MDTVPGLRGRCRGAGKLPGRRRRAGPLRLPEVLHLAGLGGAMNEGGFARSVQLGGGAVGGLKSADRRGVAGF